LEENRDISFTLKTSLNSFSIRLPKCSACGDRARSTPHTSLEPARPRGKQRQNFGNFYKSLLGYCTSKSRASSKFRSNPTKGFSLSPGLYILFGDPLHDLIWIHKVSFMTLFGSARFFFMMWSCCFP